MKSSKSVANTSVSVDLDRVRIVSSILVSILLAFPELLRAPLSAIFASVLHLKHQHLNGFYADRLWGS